jgi:hypothetical protein
MEENIFALAESAGRVITYDPPLRNASKQQDHLLIQQDYRGDARNGKAKGGDYQQAKPNENNSTL